MLTWNILIRATDQQEFSPYGTASELTNLAHSLPDFCGTIRYESEFEITEPDKFHAIEVEQVGEIAELWINGEYCGTSVGKPYHFDIGSLLKAGKNLVRVEVITSLAYREKDMLSGFLPLPISGLSGSVLLC